MPIGRFGARSIYPSLDAPNATVKFKIGEEQSLATSQDGFHVTGDVIFGSVNLSTASRPVVVDVPRTAATLNEVLVAKIRLDSPADLATTFNLEVSVPGVVVGLPGQVTIPAGEEAVQVAFAPIYTGTYQLVVRDSLDGSIVGYSTVCEINVQAEFSRQDVPAPGATDVNLGPFGANVGLLLTELQEPSGIERDHMTELWGTLYGMDEGEGTGAGVYGEGGWWRDLWPGEDCVSARPRRGLFFVKCGACSIGILTQEAINDEIEACGDGTGEAGVKPARCVPAVTLQRCREENRVIGDIPIYAQTPQLLIVDCDSGAVSFSAGEGIQVGGEVDIKSYRVCCVFERTFEVAPGPSWVRSCGTY